jgi:hypothetical protein
MYNKIFIQLYVCIVFIVFIYSIFKEREEFGCSGFTIKKQCNELKSIFFNGTTPLNTDTTKQLIDKIKKILQLHERHAVWRRCFILSTINIFLFKVTNVEIQTQTLVIYHLIMFCVIYFYHNFMNYHVYRIADTIGSQIINKMIL